MSFALGNSQFLLFPPSPLHKRAAFPSRHHHRAWKRRRIKRLTLHCQLNPFDDLFQSLLSQFPSPNAFSYVIAPALGGLALYLSSNSQKLLPNPNSTDTSDVDVGEWILFTSPTPFNRFVTLRCPSIYFPGNELLEDVNEKLVREDRHYVKLNSGRMIEKFEIGGELGDDLVYQRVCVNTDDGGVLSLDWPLDLELEEERGLDTTVLIVPGTVEGSSEREIRLFVCECLRRGVFPVVMNPRGCAGSPLTTARLFTAADSDDISTALQFVTKKRPWTTLMGVGWGYGANMLTKYLSEFGEKTPFTAVTCIDNPFDLEETARTSSHHMGFDQKLTRGLISILQSNKELFQGRGKRFDVERALSASSVRDFEKSISMVSYGFDNIEDFYAKSSTRDVVGKVKIPALFIQSDGGNIPLFSIPRGLIAENPYTSLLLCSYSPSKTFMDGRSMLLWCQNLAIEWLAAVELALLKGRHPLLKDIDFTINPSKSLTFGEREASGKNIRENTFSNPTNGHSKYPPLRMSEANDAAESVQSSFTREKGLPSKTKGLEEGDNSGGDQPNTTTIDAEIVKEGTNSSDDERGQVLQSAQVVMNMLDVTMPDILSDEQKKKVLTAVGQGQTLVKALQDAVPEDVREKLTSAVSGILQSQNYKLLSLERIPDVASELNSRVLEKIPTSKVSADVAPSSDQKKSNDPDASTKADHSSDKLPGGADLENQPSKDSKKSKDTGTIQSTSNDESNSTDLQKVNRQDTGNSFENEQLSKDSKSDAENVSEIKVAPAISSLSEGPGGTKDIAIDQKRAETDDVKVQSDQMEENGKHEQDLSADGVKVQSDHMEKTNKHEQDLSADSDNVSEANHIEEQSSAPSPASNSNNKEEGPQDVSSQTVAPPSFNVSQALGAFAGFDDSTQVAVKSVFHVIEDMIDRLEVEKDSGNEVNGENNKSEANKIDEVKEVREGSVSEDHLKDNKSKFESVESLGSNRITQSGHPNGNILKDSAGKDMIDRLEVEKDSGNEVNGENNKSEANKIDEVKEVREGSVSEDHLKDNKSKFESVESLGSNRITQSGHQNGNILKDSAGKDMIDRLEVEKDSGNEVNGENNKSEANKIDEVKEVREGSVSEDHLMDNKSKFESVESRGSNRITQSGHLNGYILKDSAGNEDTYGERNSNNSDTSNRKGFDTKNVSSFMPAAGEVSAGNVEFLNSSDRFPSHLTSFSYGDPLYLDFVKAIIYLKMRSAMDKTAALYLDYISEGGRWKILKEQTTDNSVFVDKSTTREDGYREDQGDLVSRSKHTDNIIEPSYIILDSGEPLKQNEEPKEISMTGDNIEFSASKFDDSMLFIKSLILECLNVEVGRRAIAVDIEEVKLKLARDIEYVANFVSLEAAHGMLRIDGREDNILDKLSTLDGENLIKAISSAVRDTQYLRTVVPVGVIIGSTLAALRKFFDVSALDGNNEKESNVGPVGISGGSLNGVGKKESNKRPLKETEDEDVSKKLIGEDENKIDLGNSNNDVMVGAVTAALGASALLVQQRTTETDVTLNEPLKAKENSIEPSNLEETSERAQNNIVTSLAEKAMSVASPVTPTNEDGKVDHERLVGMLAELGQKGGFLKLVGNVALLWGGLRGAMSLTDKLISFLRFSERPLFQRILGFIFMVLLLWSPVVLPMLPSLIKNWAARNPLAEFTCIAGLYVSIMIMVNLWGKRIRKYDDPLLQYGLGLTLPKFQNFLKGLVGGVILVILIHTVNYSLGCVRLIWQTTLPSSSSEHVLLIKSYGRMLMLIVQGITTATGVATVEELLFRSWLPREIEADLGYHRGIIISGLVFALTQRSTWEIPALWLLSLSLSGAQQRTQGSLSLPIGLRTGILASNFILKTGGFMTYRPNLPLWITGGHPLQPFSGVVGLTFSLILAIILYPRQPLLTKKSTRAIRQ